MRVSIVGTAGRKQVARRMTRQLYFNMVRKAHTIICDKVAEPGEVDLVSGGAAWSDHVAVSLYLADFGYRSLTLHFPAVFQDSSFLEMGGYPDPGGTANYYHRAFGAKMGGSKTATLRGIQRAIDKGARYEVHPGFHARNIFVAQSEVLIAFTWAEGDFPADGGTSHTWGQSRGRKIHIPLSTLETR